MFQKVDDPLSQIAKAQEEYSKITKKTSEFLLQQISDWLWTKAQMELLSEFFKNIPYFQSDSAMAGFLKGREEIEVKQMPQNPLSASLTKGMTQAKALSNLFSDAKTALDGNNFEKAASLLKDLSSLLLASDPARLPAFLQRGLNESMAGFTLQGPSGKTVGDLLFAMMLASKTQALKKEGVTGDSLSETLMSMMEGIAMNIPPTPFADTAQKWMKLPNPAALLKGLMASPEEELEDYTKELAALLKQIQERSEVKLSLASTQKMLTQSTDPSHQYGAYLNECEENEAKSNLQGLVKTLGFSNLEELISALQTLIPYSPDLKGEVDKLSDLIKRKIPGSLNDLTQMQEALRQIFQKLTRLSELREIPLATKQQFLSQLSKLFDRNIQAIEENELSCQKEITNLSTESTEMEETAALVSQFDQGMNVGQAKGGLSFSGFQENVQTLFGIISNTRLHSTATRENLVPFFDALNELKIQDKNFSDLMASGSAAVWLREFSRNHPGGSVDEFKSFMKSKLASLHQVEGIHPFLGSLNQNCEAMVANVEFPATTSAFGVPYVKEEAEVIAPNPDLPKAIEKSFALNANQVNVIHQAATQTTERLAVAHDENQAKVRGAAAALEASSTLKATNAKAKNDTQLKAVGESLPDEFMRIIMAFMAAQSGDLEGLAALLSVYNDGTNNFNKILGLITLFSGSDKQLDLVTFLNSIKTADGKGFLDGANLELLKSMLTESSALIDKLIAVLDKLKPGGSEDISKMIKDLTAKRDAETKGSDKYKAYDDMLKLLNKLSFATPDGKDSITDMESALSNLKSMFTAIAGGLGTTTDTPPRMTITITWGGKVYKDTDILGILQKVQDAATKGDTDPTHIPPWYVGLEDFYNAINDGVTQNSNLSQEQQIKLQMTMTTINQEWTLVATCMQTLYQTYFSLAQGVFPH